MPTLFLAHLRLSLSLLLIAMFALTPAAASDPSAISLHGPWQCNLDPSDTGISQQWFLNPPASTPIQLPGTTDLAKLGPHQTSSPPFDYHLTREYAFTGPAWFHRSITIPESWNHQEIQLTLERVMWQSRVWINGTESSPAQDSLCTCHTHSLGRLSPGTHHLAIRVDNRMIHPIGDKGHAYGNQTQSTWNGIVGDISIQPIPDNHLTLTRIFTALDGTITCEVSGVTHSSFPVKLHATIDSLPTSITPIQINQPHHHFSQSITLKIPNPSPWSEFSPHLYQLSIALKNDQGVILDQHSHRFGIREIQRNGNALTLNQRPLSLRGNLECAVFPKTGHPPTDVDSWKSIWSTYLNHGLNHARFHSWCPPEAAFTAADELGIYLQVEAPIWMDRWMAAPNPRPEMDTAGYPIGLGHHDRSNDDFAQAEIRSILDTYGNHPSFILFCIGNELGSSNFAELESWIGKAKRHDPRRLYAASTARTITRECDFNASHHVPNVGPVRQHLEPSTSWNYEKTYQRTPVPILAHEIGQWPIYPNWEAELAPYSGPLKPYRLQALANASQKVFSPAEISAFHAASGAINQLLYRDEILSFLRTPSCRGFQLLGMQDFTGQGEALVGWLDAFYQPKLAHNPASFRSSCAPIVPLISIPSRTTRSHQPFPVEFSLYHYGPHDLSQQSCSWQVLDDHGSTLASGSFPPQNFPAGQISPIGKASLNLSSLTQASHLTLSLSLDHSPYRQQESFWAYPPLPACTHSAILTHDWNTAKAALLDGKAVLLDAHQLGPQSSEKLAHWLPLYWSTPFFPGQNRDNLGLWVNHTHPALAQFPTPFFSDWNWFHLCKNSRGFNLSALSLPAIPSIVQPVPDFHDLNRLSALFETQVNQGKLIVCGFNLSDDACSQFPEALQLKHSLLSYLSSATCSPPPALTLAQLEALLAPPIPDTQPTPQLAPLPDPFHLASFYVQAGKNASIGTHPWHPDLDASLRSPHPDAYSVTTHDVRRDANHSAWQGSHLTVRIKTQAGTPGRFFARFHDWDHQSRLGSLSFEGHSASLPPHTNGHWIEFPVMREDTNDGSIVLHATCTQGPNLLLTDVAFIPDP